MFAPGYHYHLQRSARPVERPPSKEALTQFLLENLEEKTWNGCKASYQWQTVVKLPVAQSLSLDVGNFVWVEAAYTDLESLIV